MFDKQAIFEKVVAHLRTQGMRSMIEGTMSCAYRGHTGRKCAIGCLIPDEEYDAGFEKLGCPHNAEDVLDDCVADPQVAERKTRLLATVQRATGAAEIEDFNLLRALQVVHDRNFPAGWESEFADVAKKFGLVVPPLPVSA